MTVKNCFLPYFLFDHLNFVWSIKVAPWTIWQITLPTIQSIFFDFSFNKLIKHNRWTLKTSETEMICQNILKANTKVRLINLMSNFFLHRDNTQLRGGGEQNNFYVMCQKMKRLMIKAIKCWKINYHLWNFGYREAIVERGTDFPFFELLFQRILNHFQWKIDYL